MEKIRNVKIILGVLITILSVWVIASILKIFGNDTRVVFATTASILIVNAIAFVFVLNATGKAIVGIFKRHYQLQGRKFTIFCLIGFMGILVTIAPECFAVIRPFGSLITWGSFLVMSIKLMIIANSTEKELVAQRENE